MQSNIQRHTTPIGIFVGIGICLLLAIALSAVVTTLILNGTIKEDMPAYIMPLIHGVSVYVGCVVGKRMSNNKRFITEAICGGSYFLLLIVWNLLLSDNGMHRVISTVVAVFCGIVCAEFTWNSSSNRGYKGKRKVRFR